MTSGVRSFWEEAGRVPAAKGCVKVPKVCLKSNGTMRLREVQRRADSDSTGRNTSSGGSRTDIDIGGFLVIMIRI